MTTTTTRPAGAIAWIDLGSHAIAGSRAFYGDLFGWTFEDQGAEYGNYHLIHAGEALIGGLMSTVGMTCPEGGQVTTEWGVYLTTPDIAATLAQVPQAGGDVVMEAMPVGDRGQMAAIHDAGGAFVGLWQPGSVDGIDLPTTPGTPVWFEVMSTDFDAALPFYRDVLGWDVHWSAGSPDGGNEHGWRYVTHGAEDGALAGLCDAKGVVAEGTTAYWRIYLGTADIAQDLDRIPDLGGEILDGPVDSPFGRLATIRDPQGATFQLIQTPSA